MEHGGLVAGLGNPGARYENTRHNLGFMVIDHIARACSPPGVPISDGFGCVEPLSPPRSLQFTGWKWRPGSQEAGSWFLIKPQTFMNRSGEAVAGLARFHKLPAGQILAIHDELDLAPGRMKLKQGGGPAGHNGLRSIIEQLGSRDFHRLRMGIGKPHRSDTAGYVLTAFPPAQRAAIEEMVGAAARAVFLFVTRGGRDATQFLNSFREIENKLSIAAPDMD